MHVSHHSKRHESLARELSNLAVRALYFEVKSHPKPGLVSFISKGAHDDMHGGLFYRSLCALRHYFYALVRQDEAGASFAELKQLAIRAEQTMLVATEGVNTHRGALFALGLVIVSVSRLLRNAQELRPIDVHNAIKMDWHEHLNQHQPDFTSHGSLVRQRFVIVGAKEVAMQGYPMVFEHLTPFLQL
ncbi:MAG: triphosphoribosyl-dephospho-CoA synthase, partial [Legionella sp. 21-45-4]